MANINTQDILGDAYKGYGSAVGAIYSGVPTESLIGQTRFGAGSSLALGNFVLKPFLKLGMLLKESQGWRSEQMAGVGHSECHLH